MRVYEDALFIADNDIELAISVGIHGHDLCADAAVIINQVRYEGRLGSIALQLKPIKDEWCVRLRITIRTVCPAALARNNVLQSVPIDIHKIDGVSLRKYDPRLAFARLCSGNDMPYPALHTAFIRLLKPRESVTVCREARDDVSR